MGKKYLLAVLVFAFVLTAGVVYYLITRESNDQPQIQPTVLTNEAESTDSTTEKTDEPVTTSEEVHPPPIRDAEGRISKKPFGIKINPATSPVQPEKFSGYHTGTDFEAREAELSQEVAVHPICVGEIKSVKRVSGYGGVVIQNCTIKDESVSVIYGHISISKSLVVAGDQVTLNDQIAVLADHESSESGGERKHLHLGIYRGDQADLKGYVSTEAELEKWINPESILSLK
ncbi:MAG: M23 family metallopeptidase [Parcubacteria group bacterium]|nr:M23 family metallopeptidase [Parcubacteria group bacterium]